MRWGLLVPTLAGLLGRLVAVARVRPLRLPVALDMWLFLPPRAAGRRWLLVQRVSIAQCSQMTWRSWSVRLKRVPLLLRLEGRGRPHRLRLLVHPLSLLVRPRPHRKRRVRRIKVLPTVMLRPFWRPLAPSPVLRRLLMTQRGLVLR